MLPLLQKEHSLTTWHQIIWIHSSKICNNSLPSWIQSNNFSLLSVNKPAAAFLLFLFMHQCSNHQSMKILNSLCPLGPLLMSFLSLGCLSLLSPSVLVLFLIFLSPTSNAIEEGGWNFTGYVSPTNDMTFSTQVAQVYMSLKHEYHFRTDTKSSQCLHTQNLTQCLQLAMYGYDLCLLKWRKRWSSK